MRFDKLWASEDVAAGIAVCPRQRLKKRIGSKILVGSGEHDWSGEIWIEGGPDGIARVTVIRRVVGQLWSKRQPRLDRLDPAHLPIAEQPFHPEIRPVVPKRKVVDRMKNRNMPQVEGSPAIIGRWPQGIGNERRRVRGHASVHVIAIVERL